MQPPELRAIRESLGMSQREFGALVGWSQTTCSRRESGDRWLSRAEAIAVKTVVAHLSMPGDGVAR